MVVIESTAYLLTVHLIVPTVQSTYLLTKYAYHEVYQRSKQKHGLQDQSKGYPVWFSWRKHYARYHHAVLYVDGWKYELRLLNGENGRPVASVTRTRGPFDPGNADGKFECFVVGWTHKEHAEIQRLAETIIAGWEYNETTRNCQHFLEQLADRILEEHNKYGRYRMSDHLSKGFGKAAPGMCSARCSG
ncbi:hypothetical protein EDD37DRAFT_208708 [Exophiala viscosa]|uniref:uncharacterized protein n=1 Tax=Exophiala viscosa TaxID=2486360 RepID=UPI00219128A9|nr:hypothetical protein EDD37DRAFT_208708 [Exophiala viscosa]